MLEAQARFAGYAAESAVLRKMHVLGERLGTKSSRAFLNSTNQVIKVLIIIFLEHLFYFPSL